MIEKEQLQYQAVNTAKPQVKGNESHRSNKKDDQRLITDPSQIARVDIGIENSRNMRNDFQVMSKTV